MIQIVLFVTRLMKVLSICFGNVSLRVSTGLMFKVWLNHSLNTNISLKKESVLFGNYQFRDYVFNNILLVLKFNIYKSRVKKDKPSFAFGKKRC